MNVNFSAPFCQTSYGIAANSILRELCNMGHDVAIWPIGGKDYDLQAYPDQKRLVEQCEMAGRLFQNTDAPSIRLFHQFSLAERIGKGPHIGFPIFELTKFLPHEIRHMESCDMLFVASRWAKQIVEENGIKVPCHVVPLGYDPDIFYPKKEIQAKNGPFVVLNIGKFEQRKSHDLLPEIYHKAFGDDKDVEFWMVCHNPFLNKSQIDEFKKPYLELLGDRVKFLPRLNSQVDVNTIINMSDCVCLPSKAEGFNLEAIETLAVNKPLILTNYSAHSEYARDDECFLIDIDKLEAANDGIWFHGHGEWAHIGQPQVDRCVDYLRYIYKERPTLPNGFAKSFTWKNTANKILEHLNV